MNPTPGTPSTRRSMLMPLALAALAIIASGLAIGVAGPDSARRLLVLHSALAVVVLPLSFAILFGRASPGTWQRIAPAAGIITAAVVLAAIALFAPGKPVLTTWLPTTAEPAFGAVQIAASIAVAVLLIRGALPGNEAHPGQRSLAWAALPLATALVALAWGWAVSDAHAGHVRAELATWAAGHAAPFVVISLVVWAWGGLAELDERHRHAWCAAAALPALGALAILAALPIDDARALRAFPEWLRWTWWPVPALLALSILRDDIRRTVAGAPFLASLACLSAAAVAGFAIDVGGVSPAAMALRAHALPLALVAAGTALLLRLHPAPHAAVAAPANRRRTVPLASAAAMVSIGLMAILIASGTTATRPIDRLPPGESPRRHVDEKRSQEIATRFAQGVEMMRLRQYDFAVKAFHRVLELDPAIPEVHANMGFALYETGDYPGAQRFFESATRLDRGQLNAYYGLALAARAQRNPEVAVGAMRTWLHLAPQDDPFRAKANRFLEEMQANG